MTSVILLVRKPVDRDLMHLHAAGDVYAHCRSLCTLYDTVTGVAKAYTFRLLYSFCHFFGDFSRESISLEHVPEPLPRGPCENFIRSSREKMVTRDL